jgi:hypothetical protein
MSAVLVGDLRYEGLLQAAAEPSRVNSLTHGFYRYPARFGERFVREAVSSFSRRGDLVFDPFCGGGTTVVEALSQGRMAVGSDLSELALFIAAAKTTPLSESQLNRVAEWLAITTADIAPLLGSSKRGEESLRGVPGVHRNLIVNLCSLIAGGLPRGAIQRFARTMLLRTAQWALDGKEEMPTPTQFIQRMQLSYEVMRRGMIEYVEQLQAVGWNKSETQRNTNLFLSDARKISRSSQGLDGRAASLVVTSPPYLGVHVLYNRWQVGGRREISAPFYIAKVNDLGGASAYTLVDRKSTNTKQYFDAIEKSFTSVAGVLSAKAHVIQLVSFANANDALPRYLTCMKNAGLDLCDVYVSDARELKWRSVPSRRWYARVGAINDSSAANEVLLVHRKRR